MVVASGASITSTAGGVITATGVAASGVTYSMIQNESATTILGNPTSSAAAPSEITPASGIGLTGTTIYVSRPVEFNGSAILP